MSMHLNMSIWEQSDHVTINASKWYYQLSTLNHLVYIQDYIKEGKLNLKIYFFFLTMPCSLHVGSEFSDQGLNLSPGSESTKFQILDLQGIPKNLNHFFRELLIEKSSSFVWVKKPIAEQKKSPIIYLSKDITHSILCLFFF